MQADRDLNGITLTEEQLHDLNQMFRSAGFQVYERVIAAAEKRKMDAIRAIPTGDIDLFQFLQTRMMGGLDAYDEIKAIKPLVAELLAEIRLEEKKSDD